MGNQQPSSPSSSSTPGYVGQGEPILLNVYEPTNPSQASIGGMGVHHSGIELFGIEYCFGGAPGADGGATRGSTGGGTGVMSQKPKTPPPGSGWKFRETILIGKADISREEWSRKVLPELESKFPSSTYHMICNNCNDFTEAVCIKLRLGDRYPSWVNQAARMGRKFVNGPTPPTIQPMRSRFDVFKSAGHRLADGAVVTKDDKNNNNNNNSSSSNSNNKLLTSTSAKGRSSDANEKTILTPGTGKGSGTSSARKNPWRDPNFFPGKTGLTPVPLSANANTAPTSASSQN